MSPNSNPIPPLTIKTVCLPQPNIPINTTPNPPPNLPSLTNPRNRKHDANPANPRFPHRKPAFPLHPQLRPLHPRLRRPRTTRSSFRFRIYVWFCPRIWRHVLPEPTFAGEGGGEKG